MMKLKYLLLLILPFLLTACKKEQLLNQDQDKKVVNLFLKGAIINDDSLQFVLNGKILAQVGGSFALDNNLLNAGEQVQVIKKADGKLIGNIDVAASPFNQVKTIFYDGTTFSDNIVLTPVKNPENIGFRVRFSTTFKDFYGGAVDVELYELYINFETGEFTYTPVRTISNVTSKFGEFIEIKSIYEYTDIYFKKYVFKVYKAGTKELPYKSMEHVQISDPENNYGDLAEPAKGESGLISISPYISINDGIEVVGDNYAAVDLSSYFK